MNDLRVTHWEAATDGALDAGTLQRKLENAGYTVSTYAYPPRGYLPPHTHGVNKCDAVLRGRFKITCSERPVVLEPGDMMLVPARLKHSAEVVGDEAVISLGSIATGS